MYKRIGQIDESTGEVLPHTALALITPKRRNGYEHWLAVNQTNFVALAKTPMGEEARKILMALIGYADFYNRVPVSQSLLATELGMAPSHVSRAIKKLVELGVVHKGNRMGRQHDLSLSIHYGWKGDAETHRNLIREELSRQRSKGSGGS
jgi:DNA-binding transcriptional ArsR family regulator